MIDYRTTVEETATMGSKVIRNCISFFLKVLKSYKNLKFVENSSKHKKFVKKFIKKIIKKYIP